MSDGFTPDPKSHQTEARNAKRDPETLVCFALKEEARPFRNLCADIPDIGILVTGIGRRNADRSIRDYLKEHTPQRVFTCGFAGGLNPELKIGDVLFATTDDPLRLKLEGLGVPPGKFHCAPNVAVTAAEKFKLHRMTGADAVEMESEVVQAVCREHGVPCATVRSISDVANEDLPLNFNELMTDDRAISVPKLTLALLKGPWQVPRLMRLQRNTRRAARRLAVVLVKLVAV